MKITEIINNNLVEDVDPVFRMNAGKDRIVFKSNHPYFKVPKSDSDLKQSNFGLQIPVEI